LPNKQEKQQTVEEIKPSTSSSVSQLEAIDNIEEVEEEVVPVETKEKKTTEEDTSTQPAPEEKLEERSAGKFKTEVQEIVEEEEKNEGKFWLQANLAPPCQHTKARGAPA
jgi:hypothetical protein